MATEVFRITNYGGTVTDSAGGGGGVEYYAISGFGPYEIAEAQNNGLPKVGEFHPDPRMFFIGTVQAVQRVRELAPLLWIARIIYSAGGTFNFSTRLGSKANSGMEPIPLPLVALMATGVLMETRTNTIERAKSFLRFTNRTTMPAATIARISNENLGKTYTFDGLKYQFLGATSLSDAGNNTRVDTSFMYRAPIPAIAGSDFGPKYVNIPALPANCEWVTQTSDSSVSAIRIYDPEARYGTGAALPWLV